MGAERLEVVRSGVVVSTVASQQEGFQFEWPICV